MKLLKLLLILLIVFSVASCCHCKKQQKNNPAANDILKDRNTKDPKIDSLNKKVDKALPHQI